MLAELKSEISWDKVGETLTKLKTKSFEVLKKIVSLA
jgi:hypothetical protein